MKHFYLGLIVAIFSYGRAQALADQYKCCELAGGNAPDKVVETVENNNATRAKWNISEGHGPIDTLRFATDEGTWMSCDVSPDGREIIFDMLGDIYIMSFDGGKAKAITSGPAWDIQPSFSPDGAKICFTSDRSGGDNIWIMNRDGSGPKQVTDESFRLLNNPVFTADGNYIIARKHFVNTRSLGAGEMWLYHLSGGEGTQITKRRDWQHDAGEPDVSFDGRYLYYSQDVSPGNTFQYNRDPYATIYAVKQVDLETGETTTAVSGPGGASTPQINPDGKTLAFVRRVGLKTALFVKELTSGNERLLFDRLNKDAQETWAMFGVHPGYSWTPDGRYLVISAQGGFWKIDVNSAASQQIPFTADIEQIITAPVKFDNAVGGNMFNVKVVRHARVSPDGKMIVFNALGKLFIADSDGKNRKQLIIENDVFEFSPAWSPDGKKIVFTTWDDEKGGRIGVVKATGGKPKFLTIPPGHYLEPSWSPDGKQIVYRRGGGNWLRGFENTAEKGIYISAVKEVSTRLLTTDGREPRFSADGKRIRLLGSEEENNTLYSVDLNGKDKRVLATSKYANKIVLSPDEEWLVFDYRYHLYVAPYVKVGRPQELNPTTKSVPVKKVTRYSGYEPHWANNNSLHWTLGSELFSQPLNNLFSFVPGAPDSLPEPDSSGIRLGWEETADTPLSLVAFTNARIITMDKAGVIENGTIVVEGNRIINVGQTDQISVPKKAKVVDVKGRTIIPGLVDVHSHMGLNWDGITSQQNWQYYANIAFGVTTTHDPSQDTELVFTNSELQKSGRILAPRIFSTGTILYGAVHSFTAEINSLDDAKAHIQRIKAFGGFSVKSYNQPRRDQRQQVLKAAREMKMLVYPEGGSTFQHNLNMIVDGHTGIEHSIPVSPLYNDVLTLYGKSGVGYTPTLIVSYGGLWGENYWYQHTNVFEHPRLQALMPQQLLDQKRRRMKVEEDDWNFIQNASAAKDLSDAGVKVNNGAHGQLEGLGVHWEMWMMVQGGMSPMEALQVSTINGADYIGMGKDLGSIAEGKLADLVILEKNPLDDIQNSESVVKVMLNGRLYDATTLNEIVTGNRKRQPFWWQ